MNVKVCGITSFEDARAALESGAWALGFVFHKASRRYITPREAGRIVEKLPQETITVGVFVDAPLAEVNQTIVEAKLRGAQLHGVEDPTYASAVQAEFVVKAFRVGGEFDVSKLRAYSGQRILLDAYDAAAPGGTGTAFDWSVARRAGEIAPVILAGGLHAGNVARALAEAQPSALDVASGVENAPGVKDPEKLRQFFEAIRSFESGGGK
jgi:phosphoribosylanthranilate isomerase